MALNKLQLKALVFKKIDCLRKATAVDDSIVQKVLGELKDIQDADFEFIARILIKEADCNFPKGSSAFVYMAEILAPETFLELVIKELNSNKVSDNQKIFFINILSAFGINISPEDVTAYLSNPDEAINGETKRFLESAKVDPEAQIDFLDFYFSSPRRERKELVDSVVNDFDGDKLVNILSPLVLSIDEVGTILYCLDVMEKSHSLLSYKPFLYLSNSTNEKIAKKANKYLRKMQLSGLYREEKLDELYKNFLEGFEEVRAYASIPDGNSNFSIVISRKNQDDAYFVLFIAVNTLLGPFSAFGFSSLTKNDHDTVVKRFFNSCKEISVPPEYAKKILSTLVQKRISSGKVIPYEYFCWERIFDDVKTEELPVEEFLVKDLKQVELGDLQYKLIIESPFVDNWFFRYSKNSPVYSELIDSVMGLCDTDISKIENLVDEYAKKDVICDNLRLRIKYLAFCLKYSDCVDIAQIYYSLLFDDNRFIDFVKYVLKKSIYEHMLNLRVPPQKKASIFKSLEPQKDVARAQMFVNYIESNWTED